MASRKSDKRQLEVCCVCFSSHGCDIIASTQLIPPCSIFLPTFSLFALFLVIASFPYLILENQRIKSWKAKYNCGNPPWASAGKAIVCRLWMLLSLLTSHQSTRVYSTRNCQGAVHCLSATASSAARRASVKSAGSILGSLKVAFGC